MAEETKETEAAPVSDSDMEVRMSVRHEDGTEGIAAVQPDGSVIGLRADEEGEVKPDDAPAPAAETVPETAPAFDEATYRTALETAKEEAKIRDRKDPVVDAPWSDEDLTIKDDDTIEVIAEKKAKSIVQPYLQRQEQERVRLEAERSALAQREAEVQLKAEMQAEGVDYSKMISMVEDYWKTMPQHERDAMRQFPPSTRVHMVRGILESKGRIKRSDVETKANEREIVRQNLAAGAKPVSVSPKQLSDDEAIERMTDEQFRRYDQDRRSGKAAPPRSYMQ